MDTVRELSRLTVVVIVDNASDGMTSPCPSATAGSGTSTGGTCHVCSYQSEFSSLASREPGALDPDHLCNGAHGLSILLIAEAEERDDDGIVTGTTISRRLLLDAGPNSTLFPRNAQCLKVPLGEIDALVLSHYHWDHYGGIREAVKVISAERSGGIKGAGSGASMAQNGPTLPPPLIVDLHPARVLSRAASHRGTIIPRLPDFPALEELESLGSKVALNDVEHALCDRCFYVSGFIPRKTDYESGLPNNYTKSKDGKWVQDSEVREERYVACKVRGLGVVVFSSCSHAGIVNVCNDVKSKAADVPLAGVVGGFHLGGSDMEDRIERTINDLRNLEPGILLPGHCTGWKAHSKFSVAFESNYQPLSVGATYTFNSK